MLGDVQVPANGIKDSSSLLGQREAWPSPCSAKMPGLVTLRHRATRLKNKQQIVVLNVQVEKQNNVRSKYISSLQSLQRNIVRPST